MSAICHSPSKAAQSDFEGRWIRNCGQETYCRLLINKADDSSFEVFFVHTQPSTKGTPLDTDASAPDPTICEWSAEIRQQGSTDVLTGNGLTARMEGGKLAVTGIPSTCSEPGSSATFERDNADEFGDL